MVKDMRFLRVLGLAMILHMAWDSPIPETLYIKYIVIGLVGWFAAVAYIQDGLKQVRVAQAGEAVGVVPSVQAVGNAVVTPAGAAAVVVQTPAVAVVADGASVAEGDVVGGA